MSIEDILNLEEQYRDRNWENSFLDLFPNSEVSLVNEQPQQGPDGWPYLMVTTSKDTEVGPAEPVTNILDWLCDKGVGMALNPSKETPDYVFTYGMVWNFKEAGVFYVPQVEVPEGEVEFKEGQDVTVSEPSERFMPRYVRTILSTFFKDQKINDPRFAVIASEEGKHNDLAFSLESLGDPPESEYDGILEAIGWFLPTHYSIMLISEKEFTKFYSI